MSKRSNNQLTLAFGEAAKGTSPGCDAGRTELDGAETETGHPAAQAVALMERIVARDNLRKALKRVRENKGAAGIDGMSVDDLALYLKEHWPAIRTRLLDGSYKPQPVRRVEIPKPGGGKRPLGIPGVLDRFIQQAVVQVLQEDWDEAFSSSSYGFRPGRSAHQAVVAAQGFIASGRGVVVDIDLEKFFDRVNHDILMGLVSKRVSDPQVLRLIRGFLTSGVLADGLVGPTDEGVPQGGPLSPLLSNLMLNELDKELEQRGHRFARYADDCNIYVCSERAGLRVMASVERFLERRLKLKINRQKSQVARPHRRKFLGFSFTSGTDPKRCVAPQALNRFKARVRGLTRRTGGKSLVQTVEDLSPYLTGWRGYFGFCQTPSVLRDLDSWIRRRLRAIVWKQWKRGRTRFNMLLKRGIDSELAAQTAGSSHGPWCIAKSQALHMAFPNALFQRIGLPSIAVAKTA